MGEGTCSKPAPPAAPINRCVYVKAHEWRQYLAPYPIPSKRPPQRLQPANSWAATGLNAILRWDTECRKMYDVSSKVEAEPHDPLRRSVERHLNSWFDGRQVDLSAQSSAVMSFTLQLSACEWLSLFQFPSISMKLFPFPFPLIPSPTPHSHLIFPTSLFPFIPLTFHISCVFRICVWNTFHMCFCVLFQILFIVF